MSAAALPYAITALVPVLIGPLPVDSQSITVPLCNGGTLTIQLGTIPLGDGEAPMETHNLISRKDVGQRSRFMRTHVAISSRTARQAGAALHQLSHRS